VVSFFFYLFSFLSSPNLSSRRLHVYYTSTGYIFATKARIDNWKKLAKQQYLLHMSLQYGELGPLVAEILSLVWGTPANFKGFRVLAALLHGI